MTPERLDEIETDAQELKFSRFSYVRALVAMARECLRWRALGESPEAVEADCQTLAAGNIKWAGAHAEASDERDQLRAVLVDIRTRIIPTYGISRVKLAAMVDRALAGD